MTASGRVETALVVGAPLLLAILEIFHPHPHDLFRLDLRAWMAVHYLQIVLFPLAALALMRLVRGRPGLAAGLCRVCAFVFGVTWIAFDSVAGVATGILLQAAHASGSPETWRAPVTTIWARRVPGMGDRISGGGLHASPRRELVDTGRPARDLLGELRRVQDSRAARRADRVRRARRRGRLGPLEVARLDFRVRPCPRARA
jgi:hypothetical protein